MNKASLLLKSVVLLAVSFSSVFALKGATGAQPADPLRPNIVFILLDDQRWDDFRCMGHAFTRTPHIDRIAREGGKFLNAFVTTPLSLPSRASFLTGQYSHSHGITNDVFSAAIGELPILPKLLRETGYQTAFVGAWRFGADDAPQPGFDHWVSIKGEGDYVKLDLNINGQRKHIDDYATDVFTDYAVDFLKHEYKRPFFLLLSHKSAHPEVADSKFVPAERYKQLYQGEKIERRPNAAAPRGKPALEQKLEKLPQLSEKTGTSDAAIRDRLRMLATIDDSVERIFEILEDTRELNNTLIILTSDQGYFDGEHGLSSERRLAYEESIRVPMLMRYPKLIKPRTIFSEMVANIDIAPTLLQLAGAQVPQGIHGCSILPLLQGTKAPWRGSLLIEHVGDPVLPRTSNLTYQAVRSDGWKYIHYVDLDHADELYNLYSDPYETKNLMSEPAAQAVLTRLQLELVRLVRDSNRHVPIVTTNAPVKQASR